MTPRFGCPCVSRRPPGLTFGLLVGPPAGSARSPPSDGWGADLRTWSRCAPPACTEHARRKTNTRPDPSNAARKLSLFPGLLPLAGGATVRPALRSEASRLAAVPPAPLASGLARPSLPTTPPGLPLHLPLSALLPQATAHHSPSPQPPLDPGSLPRPARPSSLAATAISAL